MLSLKDRIELLERDLVARPIRIAPYSDFPFAIFRYQPDEEWQIRREVRLLATRVEHHGLKAHCWSMGDLMWESLTMADAIGPLIELETGRGYDEAEEQAAVYLSDSDFVPIDTLLTRRYEELSSPPDVVFLWRLGVLAPGLLRVSALTERLHSGGAPLVPTVLFYPGGWRGSLNFMGLRGDDEPLGSYRVKVYGRESL